MVMLDKLAHFAILAECSSSSNFAILIRSLLATLEFLLCLLLFLTLSLKNSFTVRALQSILSSPQAQPSAIIILSEAPISSLPLLTIESYNVAAFL